MSEFNHKFLLVTDVDDTVLGDAAATKRLAEYLADECQHEVLIAYASGRFFDSLKHDVDNTDLPEPAYIVGGVGSDIRAFTTCESESEWIERMSKNWSAQRIRELFADHDELHLQPEPTQSDFKVSYFYPGANQEKLNALQQRLADIGIQANVIYSSNRDLDFLPENVDKGTAGRYVADRLRIPMRRVMSAGNSGNDKTLMTQGFHGIVVGNADADLRDLANGSNRIYVSDQSHADGVIDGLRHWLNILRS